MCTAPIARIQLSCSAKRPAAFGWAARNTITARNTTVPPAMSSASELRGSSNRLGIAANPANTRIGRTTKPVSRSSTTAAKASVVLPVSAEERLMRRTSPPIVDGRRFPTNCPAR